MQLNVDADAARCNSFTLARALVAALDAHAQIINLSVAGPADPLLSDLIREGQRRGILFVGAAAPEHSDSQGAFVHLRDVIEVESFGGPANSVALQAPGREILTLLPGGRYDFASGDSIATAEVSGVLALLLAKKSDLSAAQALRLLRAGSGGGDCVGRCLRLGGETGRPRHLRAGGGGASTPGARRASLRTLKAADLRGSGRVFRDVFHRKSPRCRWR